MANVKTHKFSTGVFQVVYEHLDGLCDMPECNHPTHRCITISTDLTPFDELETLIHESTHAEHPGMNEQRVHDSAHNIARLLWRLGYRKVKR